jgi:hypothetical protein
VTQVGERSPDMLAEVLRIESELWRSPGLSDPSRVMGLVHLLVEAAGRVDRDPEGPFAGEVVAAWENAVRLTGRPIDPDALFAGFQLAERLVFEAVWLEAPHERQDVMTYCRSVLARLGALPRS